MHSVCCSFYSDEKWSLLNGSISQRPSSKLPKWKNSEPKNDLLAAHTQLYEAQEIRQEWEATYAGQTQQEVKIAQEYDMIQKYMQRQKGANPPIVTPLPRLEYPPRKCLFDGGK